MRASYHRLSATVGRVLWDSNVRAEQEKILLGKFVITALNDRGMLVQEGLEWFFDPKPNAPPDGRVAESPESTQAEMGKQLEAAESTNSTVLKHIEACNANLRRCRTRPMSHGHALLRF